MSDPIKPFNEKLYSKLSTIFGKTIGHNLDIRQIAAINHEVNLLADIIAEFVDARATLKALDIIKMLQGEVVAGFKVMDAQVEDFEKRIKALEKK